MHDNMMLNPNLIPVAGYNKPDDEPDDLAQERRLERLERKKQDKRDNGLEAELEEVDPDIVLEEPKKVKRSKKKKQRPDLWMDDRIDDEDLDDEFNIRRRKGRRNHDDRFDWDE